MSFDPCPHLIKQLIIRCGQLLHPEEKDITKLYLETTALLGMAPISTVATTDGQGQFDAGNSVSANRLPAPGEMKKPDGSWVVPRRNCSECGGINTTIIYPLCRSCKDAEGGTYKSMWECTECHFKERSEKAFVQWMDELGINTPTGRK